MDSLCIHHILSINYNVVNRTYRIGRALSKQRYLYRGSSPTAAFDKVNKDCLEFPPLHFFFLKAMFGTGDGHVER